MRLLLASFLAPLLAACSSPCGDTLPSKHGGVEGALDMVASLGQALTWSDPCDGVTSRGHCDGAVAVRCVGLRPSKRRVFRTNCAAMGAACVVAADVGATCEATR